MVQYDLSSVSDEEYNKLREDAFVMFSSPGWAFFIAELTDSYKAADSVADLTTEPGLHFRRGELAAMARILNYEDMLKQARDSEGADA